MDRRNIFDMFLSLVPFEIKNCKIDMEAFNKMVTRRYASCMIQESEGSLKFQLIYEDK